MSSYSPLRLIAITLLLLMSGISSLRAHRVTSVSLVSHLDTREQTYSLEATMEVVPSTDMALNDLISPEDAAREFTTFLIVMFDRVEDSPAMEIRLEELTDADTPAELRRHQAVTTLSGRLPDGAKEFLLYLDPRCPMAVVMVVILNQVQNQRLQVILAGEYSQPESLLPVQEPEASETGGLGMSEQTATSEDSQGPKPPNAFTSGWKAFFNESPLPALLLVGVLLLTLGRKSVSLQLAILLIAKGLLISLVGLSVISPVPIPSFVLAGSAALLSLEALAHRHLRWWRIPILIVAGLALGSFITETVSCQSFEAASENGLGRVALFLLGTEAALILTALAAASILLPLSRFRWYRQSLVAPLAVLLAGYAIFTLFASSS